MNIDVTVSDFARIGKGGEKLITFILGVASVVCAGGWLGNKLALYGVIQYIKEKDYTPPTPVELRACIRKIVNLKR